MFQLLCIYHVCLCLSLAKEAQKWKGLHPARLFLKLRKLQLANAKTSKYVYRKQPKGGITGTCLTLLYPSTSGCVDAVLPIPI